MLGVGRAKRSTSFLQVNEVSHNMSPCHEFGDVLHIHTIYVIPSSSAFFLLQIPCLFSCPMIPSESCLNVGQVCAGGKSLDD